MTSNSKSSISELLTVTLFVLFTSLLAICDLYAQQPSSNLSEANTHFERKVLIGVEGGFAVSHLAGSDPTFSWVDLTSRNAGAFGGFVYLSLSPTVGIQTELLYATKGYQWRAKSQGTIPLGATVAVDYLEIPLLTRIKFCAGKATQPYVTAGPFLAFRLRARAMFDGYSQSITESFASTDYGLAFGAGVIGHIGSREVMLEAKYDLGVSHIMASYYLQNAWDQPFQLYVPSMKSGALMVMLGFSF